MYVHSGNRVADTLCGIDIAPTLTLFIILVAAVWGTPYEYCPFWPVRAVERYQGPFNKKLSNKVLIVSNLVSALLDIIITSLLIPDRITSSIPVTPLNAAQALADTLGDSATLVVQEGFGVCKTVCPRLQILYIRYRLTAVPSFSILLSALPPAVSTRSCLRT